ncbi:hypothetical protein SBA4_1220006 [Candidatus Sulfopaludibacter sp. SbA4]|nr:hypothetical protein SBA4_1220006 [Candidatus Sulfopaludibacter sp. SbA4]
MDDDNDALLEPLPTALLGKDGVSLIVNAHVAGEPGGAGEAKRAEIYTFDVINLQWYIRLDDKELPRQGYGASRGWRKGPPVGAVPAPGREAFTHSRLRYVARRLRRAQLQPFWKP